MPGLISRQTARHRPPDPDGYAPRPRSTAPLAIALATVAFAHTLGAGERIVPGAQERLVFRREYPAEHLDAHPEQRLRSVSLVLSRTLDGSKIIATFSGEAREGADVPLSTGGFAKVSDDGRALDVSAHGAGGRFVVESREGAVIVRVPAGDTLPLLWVSDAPGAGVKMRELVLRGADPENAVYKLFPAPSERTHH